MENQPYYITELQGTWLVSLSCLLCSLVKFYVQSSEDVGLVQMQGFCIGTPPTPQGLASGVLFSLVLLGCLHLGDSPLPHPMISGPGTWLVFNCQATTYCCFSSDKLWAV